MNWDSFFVDGDANGNFYHFVKCLQWYHEQSFPLKIFRPADEQNKRNKWYTAALQKDKDVLCLIRDMLKTKPSEKLRSIYKKFKSKYKRNLSSAKRDANSDLLTKASNKNKAAWQIIKNKNTTNANGVEISLQPDDLNNFFIELPGIIDYSSQSSSVGSVVEDEMLSYPEFLFQNVDESQVCKIIMSLKGKTSEDCFGFSNNLIKQTVDCYLTPLTKLINDCLQKGIFPNVLKTTKIVPIFKKGDINKEENYRPVGIVPIFSKIIETVVATQLVEYLESNGILANNQYGYKKGCSTIDAIQALVTKITEAFEKKEVCVATFCDLSKAFDLVSHEILVKKLEKYGILGRQLSFFKDYLEGREQYVDLKGNTSTRKAIRRGVIQGSVLGPVLFIIYFNSLAKMFPDNSVLYADDATIVTQDKDMEKGINDTNICLGKAREWLRENNMTLNENKTSTVVFNSRAQEETEAVNFLGITLDTKLSWKQHIRNLTGKLCKVTYQLRKLRGETNEKVIMMAYYGLFHSILSYGILLWGASSEAKKIFKIQKKALRIICRKSPRDHCRPIFIRSEIFTMICLFIYKNLIFIRTKTHPVIRSDIHAYNLRNKQNINIPSTRLIRSDMNPDIMAAKLFNKLPKEIRILEIKQFKKTLRIFLIKNSFYELEEFTEVHWTAEDFNI